MISIFRHFLISCTAGIGSFIFCTVFTRVIFPAHLSKQDSSSDLWAVLYFLSLVVGPCLASVIVAFVRTTFFRRVILSFNTALIFQLCNVFYLQPEIGIFPWALIYSWIPSFVVMQFFHLLLFSKQKAEQGS